MSTRLRRLAALIASTLVVASADDAHAEPLARSGGSAQRSEYRLYAGLRHPGELLSANALTLGRLVLRGIDASTQALEDHTALPRPVAIAERTAVFLLVDAPVLSYTLVLPHELFGHASRQREFDARPTAHIDLPLPYSLRADHYVTHRSTRLQYGGEQSVAALGGLQAQEGYQRLLVATSFRAGVLRRGEALIYASTALTHAAQTLAGGDLENAALLVAPLYRGDPATYRTTARGALLLDLIDPMLLYSLYAAADRYLVYGERATKTPSLRLGRARMLATSRTLAVPWGVEHQLHLLAAWPESSWDLGLRTGLGARSSFGAELTTFDWRFLQVMRAGAEVAVWIQPLVSSVAALGQPTLLTLSASARGDVRDRTTTGAAARVLFELDQPRWFLGTRLGYKSLGLWGERELDAGFEVAMTGGVKLE